MDRPDSDIVQGRAGPGERLDGELETPAESSGASDASVPMFVGTMGWSYSDWNGVLYPDSEESRNRLPLYSRTFDTVEIDSTFYGTPRPSVVRHWRDSTPPSFRFCAKVPREITHEMGLVDVFEPLAQFVEVMSGLGEKRGPLLFQMPPSFTLENLDALEQMLPLLRRFIDPDIRFAIEFRHTSLLKTEVLALLKEHRVALAATDHTGLPRRLAITSDFVYLRLIGTHGAFPTHRSVVQDRSDSITRWADALQRHRARFGSAWIFCNNDFEGFAPETAWKMQEALGLETRRPDLGSQGSLF